MREIEYWIWISSLEGMGAVKAMGLLKMYKNPRIVYEMSEHELKQTKLLTDKNIQEILDKQKRERVNKIYELMIKHNIKMINVFDDNYPYNLKQIYDPPIALYYKGKFELNDFAIAIVGSRRTTNYGSYSAKKLAYDLSLRGVPIVSGLARGIDSIAHEGCLAAGGKTIAVLGCGLDTIYPPENTKLCEDIIKSDGLVISEYPPGMPPLQHNFPARNRIISGISSGVLVVEAAKRSGSLITACYALEQGREVFAIPGNIDCAYSRGTNQLIKDGAKMVLCAEDVLEEFDYIEASDNSEAQNDLSKRGSKTNFSIFRGLSTEEIRIAKIISNGIHDIDEIIDRSNNPTKEVNNILFMLEMKGVITQLPGKIFNMCL
ncbi:MAG TPA: DNA-processing protein DprA [Ruminiclostridium sp.]